MLCQKCQNKIANVHYTQVINDKKVEMFLCEQCASIEGKIGFGSTFGLNDFISSIIGYQKSQNNYFDNLTESTSCEKCGLSYETFQKIGKMGCSNCYKVYGDRLTPIIKRLHGSTEYRGKMPNKTLGNIMGHREIDELRERLQQAIKDEEYEKAAKLRDMIKKIETDK